MAENELLLFLCAARTTNLITWATPLSPKYHQGFKRVQVFWFHNSLKVWPGWLLVQGIGTLRDWGEKLQILMGAMGWVSSYISDKVMAPWAAMLPQHHKVWLCQYISEVTLQYTSSSGCRVNKIAKWRNGHFFFCLSWCTTELQFL